jgi:hypothetical protein
MKLTVDHYFSTLTAEALSNFFFQQFLPTTYDFVDRMNSMGSQSTAVTQFCSIGNKQQTLNCIVLQKNQSITF